MLAALEAFQRASVDQVFDRFYGDANARRFLVADETGLGKSVVARGVVARTIEYLQGDPTVGRIDVVYVCSNFDTARQNLRRLDVTGGSDTVQSGRLSLLARDAQAFEGVKDVAATPVNLIAPIPGTSFSSGWRTGHAEERPPLYLDDGSLHLTYRKKQPQVLWVTGEHLIAGQGQLGEQRVDDVRGARFGQEFTGPLGVGPPHWPDVDHGQVTGQPCLPGARPPGLAQDRGARDEVGAATATQLDQASHPSVAAVDADHRTGVEDEVHRGCRSGVGST